MQANIRNSRRISGVSVSPRSGRNGARHERSGGLCAAKLTREGRQPLRWQVREPLRKVAANCASHISCKGKHPSLHGRFQFITIQPK